MLVFICVCPRTLVYLPMSEGASIYLWQVGTDKFDNSVLCTNSVFASHSINAVINPNPKHKP